MKRSYVLGGSGAENTNLSLDPEVKALGKKLAKGRYRTSLSGLFEILIMAESKRKRGVSTTRLKEAA